MLLLLCACENATDQALLRARDAVFAGNYAQAEALYRGLLEPADGAESLSGSDRRRALMELGRLDQLYLQRPEQAVADYRQVVEEFPDSEDAFVAQLAVADITEHALGNREQAITEYQRLLAEHAERPGIERYQMQVARLYMELRHHDQARTEAGLFLRRYPQSEHAVEVRMIVATSFALERRTDDAMRAYREVLDADPPADVAAQARVELARLHQARGEDALALEELYKALPDHPNPKAVQVKITDLRQRQAANKPSEGIPDGRFHRE